MESEYPEKLKIFVGREEYFNKIDELFKAKQIVSISAFGGTGKSSLALEYCHRLTNKDSNSKIRWLDAASSNQFEDDFKLIAQSFNIDIKSFQMNYIIDKLYSKLKELNNDILFVFDNLESYDDIKEYIRRLPSNMKILITTRDSLNDSKIVKLELEPFNLDETKEYVKNNIDLKVDLNEENTAKIIDLSKSTESSILPIKIELVVSYVNAFSTEKTLDKALNDIIENQYLYSKIEAKVLNFLKEENEIGFKLLRFCGYLDPDFIEKKLLFNLYDKMIKVEYHKQDYFNKAFELLSKLSLISLKTKNKINGVKIHRLIQEEIINFTQIDVKYDENLEKNENILNKIMEYLNENFNYEKDDPKTWKKIENIYYQAKHISNKKDAENYQNIYEFFTKILDFELNSRKISKNSLNLLRIIEDIQKPLNVDHPYLASSFNKIGAAFSKLNDHNKALEFHVKAYEMRQRLYKTDHPDLAESLNNIGTTYTDLNEHKNSLEYHLKAYEMLKKLHKTDQPSLAASLNNIGYSYGKLNDHKNALEYKLKAYEMHKKFLVSDHPDLAIELNNIGITYSDLNDVKNALEYHFKAYEMRKRLYGNESDHQDLAESLNNIGTIYSDSNEYDQALKFKQEALEMQQRLYENNDHPDLALSLNNMGMAFVKLNDRNEALKYLIKSYEMRKRLYGDESDHPELAESLNNIGATYGDLNIQNMALEYHRKAHEMKQRLYGGDHPDLAISLNNLGMTHVYLGEYKEALECQQKAYEMQQKLYEDGHQNLAISLNNIAMTHIYLADYKFAIDSYLKACEILKNIYKTDNPLLATILNNIGATYGKSGDDKLALEYKLQAYEMRKRLYEEKENSDLAESLSDIATTYLNLNETEMAIDYFLKAFEMQKRLNIDASMIALYLEIIMNKTSLEE